MRPATPGYTPAAREAPLLPLLVLPSCTRSEPLWPCAVASTEGSIETPVEVEVVLGVFVIAVVENVTVAEGAESESAVVSMKTRAKPGAGL